MHGKEGFPSPSWANDHPHQFACFRKCCVPNDIGLAQAFLHLSLLEQKPDLSEWKDLSAEDFLTDMGGGNYRGRQQLIDELQKLSDAFSPTPPAVSLMIRSSAQTILQARRQLKEMKKLIRDITANNTAVKTLEKIRGVSVLTSSTLMAEIIDIRRLTDDDRLASYSGLGRSEYSTGDRSKMIPNPQFNHRLKDLFITAAKNFVLHNLDSHLSGYFRNLRKKRGMKANEAYKRVARALVRVIFRKLRSLIEERSEEQNRSESDMASGADVRSDLSHESNISLSSPDKNDSKGEEKIKGSMRSEIEEQITIFVEKFADSS